MADGIIIVGSQTIGFTERRVYVYWDIPPDLLSDRHSYMENPYRLFINTRYAGCNYIQHIYITRWVHVEYEPTPITEREVYLEYSLCQISERHIYFYPDSRERMVFAEGLFTQTPLLLKYPKYYNWNYIPQIISPEFIIWSFYPLDEDNITLVISTDQGTHLRYNSGTNPDSFRIEKITEEQYKVTVFIDHEFNNSEVVTCYLTAFDTKGNHLKDGMW